MTDEPSRPEWADDPPDPPVEAMWGVIRETLASGDAIPVDGVASIQAPQARPAPSAGTWIPLLVAAGLVGLMVGRWTAPVPSVESPTQSSVALEVGEEAGSEVDGDQGASEYSAFGSDGAAPSDGASPPAGGSPPIGPPRSAGATAPASASPVTASSPSDGGTPPAGVIPPATDVLPPADFLRRDLAPDGSPSGSSIDEEESGTGQGGPTPFRFAATRHILEVGPLLTRLAGGSDPSTGRVPVEVRDWADQLLHETRLLLDSPDPIEPDLLGLLEDLELILTQVVTLPTTRSEAVKLELELIAEGMSERRILPRIHIVALAGETR